MSHTTTGYIWINVLPDEHALLHPLAVGNGIKTVNIISFTVFIAVEDYRHTVHAIVCPLVAHSSFN